MGNDHETGTGNGEILRAAVPASIEKAAEQDGKFRIRGVANTFTLMHSGRVFAPTAFDRWLKRTGSVRLPLLLNHGVAVNGPATIGGVDGVTADQKRGLLFNGWVAEGTQNANDARALISQAALRSVSIGWVPRRTYWVRRNNADIEPWLVEQMDASGVDEAHVCGEADLVEISVVDVADDPGAILAARADAAALAELRQEVAGLRAEVAAIKAAGGVDVAGLQAALAEQLDSFLDDFKLAAVEALMHDPEIVEGARAAHEDLAADLQDSREASTGNDDDLSALVQRVAKGPGR